VNGSGSALPGLAAARQQRDKADLVRGGRNDRRRWRTAEEPL